LNKLRLVFEKGEAARYIGHLDVLRVFIRALRRAELPVKYSAGFNPHALMTFALPLGVGVTSECELVDLAVTAEVPAGLVVTKLNAVLPTRGIRVNSAEYTEQPFAEIIRAEYVIVIQTDGAPAVDALRDALAAKEILVEKKSKKTVKEINIMEHIFQSEITDVSDDSVTLRAVISAGNTFNVKPQLVVAALASAARGLNPIATAPCRKKFITV
jgi:radical SAM-linked protein